jgi:soluble lytic murein transglycosylase-like protein
LRKQSAFVAGGLMLMLSGAGMAFAQSDDRQPAPRVGDAAAASAAAPGAADLRKAKRRTKQARLSARHRDAAKSVATDAADPATASPEGAAAAGTTVVAQAGAQAVLPGPPSLIAALHDIFTSHAAPAAAAPADAQALAYPNSDGRPAWPDADLRGGRERLSGDDARRASMLHTLVAKHAAENGVPFGLADAIIRIESRYTPGIMHAGNYGLMQLRAETARGMGFSGSPGALLDPEVNLRFGMKYLGQAYKLAHGDTCLTVMRYQSGFGATRLSAANRAYCARARSMMAGL